MGPPTAEAIAAPPAATASHSCRQLPPSHNGDGATDDDANKDGNGDGATDDDGNSDGATDNDDDDDDDGDDSDGTAADDDDDLDVDNNDVNDVDDDNLPPRVGKRNDGCNKTKTRRRRRSQILWQYTQQKQITRRGG